LPFLDRVKDAWPDTTVLVGGVVGTLDHHTVLSTHAGVDACVRGERDGTLAELAGSGGGVPDSGITGLATRQGPGRARDLLPDLDVLGSIARDGIRELLAADRTGRVAYLQSSRGCPCRCTFCAVPDVFRLGAGSPWRGRSPSVVVAEMTDLQRDHDIGSVVFQDDNFVGPGRGGQERARAIAARLIEEHLDLPFSFCCTLASLREDTLSVLMEAGLSRIGISVEATDADSLRLLAKGHRPDRIYPALRLLERLGLRSDINLIFFGPYTTIAAVRDSLRLLEYVRESTVLGYSDAFPFTTLHAFPWSRVAGRLADESLGDRATGSWQFRDSRVAAVAAFTARLQRASRTTFKHREVIEGGAQGAVPHLASAAAVRTWLGLWLMPHYVGAACDVVESEGEGESRTGALDDLVTAFASEVGVVRRDDEERLLVPPA
jgi:radical SAM superfamily enzyme YgiQ (UPF0313 family)